MDEVRKRDFFLKGEKEVVWNFFISVRGIAVKYSFTLVE